ncbi:permease [Halogeometricum borinquense DSM 11551]|uniref:Permease n=2 Tax=Halogeometricum borinquense TaxID=60847 RepID=E4NSI7_HALBP|nr:AEC family transporter [Halogeometricum borinquense]ADQ68080.1 predicted permease [Halogeometricum borinquense DSM 11551]ELY24876.1 permease [Halogeometricum borinquense DSM 11551]RYJ13008.1 AEC family transporter [Halogeometricum borinquense]
MESLFSIFATAILPILVVGAVGFVLGRAKDIDTDPLNTVVVYILAPALVFHSLATTTLAESTLVQVAGAVTVYHLVMIVVAEGVGRAFSERDPLLSALVLVSAFPNSGNYGVPVSNFAFGETGRATAVLFLSVQGVLIYTVGVYIASRGGGASGLAGLKEVFRIPLVYAVIAALLARGLGIVPPADATSMATLKLVGDASIPVMLIILGIQLARTDVGATLRTVGVVTTLKMIVAPVIGVGVALVVGFSDPAVAKTFVLESAMPAAVTPLILVAEFAEGKVAGVPVAEFVSTAVFVTTLVSIPILTAVIAILESGLLF